MEEKKLKFLLYKDLPNNKMILYCKIKNHRKSKQIKVHSKIPEAWQNFLTL